MDEIYHGSDVVIVDCTLEYFEAFSSVLAAAADALNDRAWIVFMHDFAELQNSSTVSAIADTLQGFNIQLFSFCQTVRGQIGSCMNFSNPASVYYHLLNDTLTAISQAVISSSFDGTALSHQVVHLSTMTRTLSVLEEGADLVSHLRMQCVDTVYGKLALTTGEATPHNCVETSRVQFQLLSLVNIPQWTVAGRWTADGQSELTADIPKFVHTSGQEDTLTFSGKLRVLFGLRYPPFSYSNTTHNYSGVDFDLLFMIAEKLGIEEHNIEFTPLGAHYSWTDMVAMVGKENSQYDMAIGGITATATRGETSNFTRNYLVPGISILAMKPGTSANYMWRFFEPFKWTVWILILGMVALSCFVSKWLGLAHDYKDGLWLSSIILFFMNENRLVAMRNLFGRIYITALGLVVLILVSAYTANMATFLTSQGQSTEIQGFSSLKRQPVSVDNSSISYSLLQEEIDLRNLVPVSHLNVEWFRTGRIVAYIGDTPEVIQIASVQPQCDLYVLEDEYFQNPFAFAISDKLVVTHGRQIDDVIADAVARQLVSTWYDIHLQYDSKCDNVRGIGAGDATTSGNLDVDNLGGVFIISAVAAVICLAVRGVLLLKQHSKMSRVAVAIQNA